ncbi:hypothetical protein PR001_g9358 [Phytophthora rubi]|uniref:Uncharacterized protein n=1 Tax=Phytophthora rubi TaxID=129364 RepID=A0A6A3N4P1_9STRA|nr:hypothetical protein PR002_g9385 [Phytophthora rubi]KAE9035314.1 hypothetical protein PR001_g9358 [Phytophthora rubi]
MYQRQPRAYAGNPNSSLPAAELTDIPLPELGGNKQDSLHGLSMEDPNRPNWNLTSELRSFVEQAHIPKVALTRAVGMMPPIMVQFVLGYLILVERKLLEAKTL